jgi:hypothetical protein
MSGWDDPLEAPETGEPVSPEQTRSPYERIEQLLASLPTLASSPGWRSRVLDAIRDPPKPASSAARPRQSVVSWSLARSATMAVSVASVAAIALVLVPWPNEQRLADPIVTTEIRRGLPNHGQDVNIGDILVVRGEAGRPIELRVYDNSGEPLARCSDSGGCTVQHYGSLRRYLLELPLTSRGDVRILLFVGDAIPAAIHNLDVDVVAARDAGVGAQQIAVAHVQ